SAGSEAGRRLGAAGARRAAQRRAVRGAGAGCDAVARDAARAADRCAALRALLGGVVRGGDGVRAGDRRRRVRGALRRMTRVAIVEPADAGLMLEEAFHARGVETVIVNDVNDLRGVSAVVAGSERGVSLADALSEALGVATNGTALSAARRDKFVMIETVRARGLRAPAQLRSATLA